MFDFTKLWDKRYLFGPNPVDLSRSDVWFFWLAVGAVALAVIVKLLSLRMDKTGPKRFLVNRFFHLFLTAGLLVLLWSGLRFENIPWLGTRFVTMLVAVVSLVWLVFIIKYLIVSYPGQQKYWQEQQLKQKYLK